MTKHVVEERRWPTNKLLTAPQAVEEIAQLRKDNRVIVFTNGCFDIIHAGHVDLLRQCRELGDHLIVGLNSDESVRRLKPGRPFNHTYDRAMILTAIRSVSAVVVFHEDTPTELIRLLHPDVLAKGSEYQESEIPGSDVVRQYGGRVVRVQMVPGYSTSGLVDKIRSMR